MCLYIVEDCSNNLLKLSALYLRDLVFKPKQN